MRGSSVLELGCGTGAVGLYAAALGARRVTCTDGGPMPLLQLAEANVRANRRLWAARATEVKVVSHQWGESMVDPSLSGHDWVLGSDVTYAVDVHDQLCRSLATQLETLSPNARAVLSHQHRAGTSGAESATDERLHSFMAAAEASGLIVSSIRTASLDHGGRRISLLSIERQLPPPV